MKKLLPAVIALAGGGVGFALRKWQLATGFEPETGLPVTGALSAVVLAEFSCIVALLILLLSRSCKARNSWDRAFAGARRNTVFVSAILLAGFLLVISGGVELVTRTVNAWTVEEGETAVARAVSKVLPPIRLLLCIGGFPAVFLWGRELFTGGSKGKEHLGLLELCLLFCLWLISDYQRWASCPTVMEYIYEVFAIIFSLLGLYYLAGYSFQEGKPRRSVFFCLMGAYFSLVTLADSHALADILRYGFAVLFLTAHAALILTQPAGEAPAEEEMEAEDNA